jgi:hypothetical protein
MSKYEDIKNITSNIDDLISALVLSLVFDYSYVIEIADLGSKKRS